MRPRTAQWLVCRAEGFLRRQPRKQVTPELETHLFLNFHTDSEMVLAVTASPGAAYGEKVRRDQATGPSQSWGPMARGSHGPGDEHFRTERLVLNFHK